MSNFEKFNDFARKLLGDNPSFCDHFRGKSLIYHPGTGRFTFGYLLKEGVWLAERIAHDLGCTRGEVTQGLQSSKVSSLVKKFKKEEAIAHEQALLQEVIQELGRDYGYRLRRVMNRCHTRQGTFTYSRISELLQFSPEEMRCRGGIGEATLQKIQQVLEARGWRLDMSLGEVHEHFPYAVVPEHKRFIRTMKGDNGVGGC